MCLFYTPCARVHTSFCALADLNFSRSLLLSAYALCEARAVIPCSLCYACARKCSVGSQSAISVTVH